MSLETPGKAPELLLLSRYQEFKKNFVIEAFALGGSTGSYRNRLWGYSVLLEGGASVCCDLRGSTNGS